MTAIDIAKIFGISKFMILLGNVDSLYAAKGGLNGSVKVFCLKNAEYHRYFKVKKGLNRL